MLMQCSAIKPQTTEPDKHSAILDISILDFWHQK